MKESCFPSLGLTDIPKGSQAVSTSLDQFLSCLQFEWGIGMYFLFLFFLDWAIFGYRPIELPHTWSACQTKKGPWLPSRCVGCLGGGTVMSSCQKIAPSQYLYLKSLLPILILYKLHTCPPGTLGIVWSLHRPNNHASLFSQFTLAEITFSYGESVPHKPKNSLLLDSKIFMSSAYKERIGGTQDQGPSNCEAKAQWSNCTTGQNTMYFAPVYRELSSQPNPLFFPNTLRIMMW